MTVLSLTRQANQEKRGIDALFEVDEGAEPSLKQKALASLRAGDLAERWVPVRLNAGGHTAWYLGPKASCEDAVGFFTAELGEATQTGIFEAYNSQDPWHTPCDGWWVLDPVSFTLFLDKHHALIWLKGLRLRRA